MTEKRLIDADAFIEDIKTEITELFMNGLKGTPQPRDHLYDFINRIGEQPTVDAVEVLHGRWIHPKGYVVSNGFLCSECGHEEYSLFPINPRSGGVCIADENGNFYHPPKMNYCPNCGAKMDGDGNG